MKYVISIICVILFSTVSMAGERVRVTEHVDEHGKRTVFFTTKQVLEKCPAWKLDKEPPFPTYKAVGLAQAWIKKKYPKFSSVHTATISISPIWDNDFRDRWYYTVTSEASADLDGVTANSYFSVIVLMDGTIVEPSAPKNDDAEDCQQDSPSSRK